MYNWSTDTKELEKDSVKFTIWKLEQMINYGLNERKLEKKELKQHLGVLNLDSHKKQFLKFLLDDRKYPLGKSEKSS